jgi:hypothetical protein
VHFVLRSPSTDATDAGLSVQRYGRFAAPDGESRRTPCCIGNISASTVQRSRLHNWGQAFSLTRRNLFYSSSTKTLQNYFSPLFLFSFLYLILNSLRRLALPFISLIFFLHCFLPQYYSFFLPFPHSTALPSAISHPLAWLMSSKLATPKQHSPSWKKDRGSDSQ